MKNKNEFDFKNAKPVGNRFRDKNVKVTITSRIDPNIVAWLRSESEKKGIRYQTFMNSVLKQAMNGSLSNTKNLRKVIREELDRKKKKTA